MAGLPPARVEPLPTVTQSSLARASDARSALLARPGDRSPNVESSAAEVLARERAAGAKLEAALSVLDGLHEPARETLNELGRNRETIAQVLKNTQKVEAAADEGRDVTRRMQRRTGFSGMFVQLYEAMTGR